MEIIRYVTVEDLEKFKDYDTPYNILGLLRGSLSKPEYSFIIPIKITIPDREVKD